MEKRVVRYALAGLLFLTVLVSFVLLNSKDIHLYALQKQVEFSAKAKMGYSVLDLMRDETDILKKAGDEAELKKQLRLELPENISVGQVKVKNLSISQTIEIRIPNIGDSYFYDYPMIGSSDHITDITFDVEDGKGIIDIALDSVYEPDIVFEDNYLHLGFIPPRECYDYIVVVDAGHGGSAPGAMKQGISEKDIDLAIVKQLKDFFDKSDKNIGVYYTRLDDSNPSLESRVALANTLKADVFLSIHNNATASGRMSGINGTEVMYKVSDASGLSKQFAKVCLDSLLNELGSQSKGVVAGDDIYIIRTSEVPVALAEIGFMTNQEELDKLGTKTYQRSAAKALYHAVTEMLEVLYE